MIVFTENFTVGADVDPASYPGTPDYSYLKGSVNDAQITAANDRCECVVTGADVILRLLNAACPTGDQQITIDSHTGGGDDNGTAAARCHASTADAYVGQMDLVAANEVAIWRVTTGAFTNLVTADRGFTDTPGTHSYRLKAIGTNPVDLEFQVDATAVVTFSDSSVDRKQSGKSGHGGYNDTTRAGWVDNISVDDLLSGTLPRYGPQPAFQQRLVRHVA